MTPSSRWSRRGFLTSTLVGMGAWIAPAAHAQTGGTTGIADTTRRAAPKPPPLPLDLVREFVGAAHGNLDRTRELLGNEPGLLNATWDWKAGDFETALGGAGHMGRRDIALFLIGEGARTDLFVSAMLGDLEVVRAILTAHPNLAASKGPHGITLMRHAEAGGREAEAVVAYLESLAPPAK